MSNRLLRIIRAAPLLIGSIALTTLVMLALLPAILAFAVLAAIPVVLAWTRTPTGEHLAMTWLTRARPPRPHEWAVLLPALNAWTTQVGGPARRIYLQHPRPGTPAVDHCGRVSIVITTDTVDLLRTGAIDIADMVTTLIHTEAAARAHHMTIPTSLVTAPITVIAALIAAFGRGLAQIIPLLGLAWRLRGVVGAITPVHATLQGHPYPGLLGAAFVAATYAIPAADHALQHRGTQAGDHAATTHSLGTIQARILQRSHRPIPWDRIHHLQHPPTTHSAPLLADRFHKLPPGWTATTSPN